MKIYCKNGHNKLEVGTFKPFQCKQCNRDRKKKYRKLYPEKHRLENKRYNKRHPRKISFDSYRRQLLRRYGLTLESYNTLLQNQGNKCAICKRYQSKKAFAVDHNHQTGQVRGLLCYSCNVGLGHFKDNLKILESATKYLVSL